MLILGDPGNTSYSTYTYINIICKYHYSFAQICCILKFTYNIIYVSFSVFVGFVLVHADVVTCLSKSWWHRTCRCIGNKKKRFACVFFDKGNILLGSDTDRIIELTNKRHVKSDQLSDWD